MGNLWYDDGTKTQFSATPTVTSITFGSGTALSTYQQGTFTPALSIGGSSTGITYSTQSGEYTQIGNVVYFAIKFVLSSTNSLTGAVLITGLPVAAASAFNTSSSVAEFGNITLTALYSGLYVQIPAGTSMSLNQVGSGQAQTSFSQGSGAALIANNGVLIFNGFYFTS